MSQAEIQAVLAAEILSIEIDQWLVRVGSNDQFPSLWSLFVERQW